MWSRRYRDTNTPMTPSPIIAVTDTTHVEHTRGFAYVFRGVLPTLRKRFRRRGDGVWQSQGYRQFPAVRVWSATVTVASHRK